MHPADTASSDELDADHPCDGEHAADRGGAHVACDRARREVARSELPRIGVEALELVVAETDTDASVEDADRGRGRARLPDRAFHCLPDLYAVRRRKPVRDDGGLERDHRPPVVERSANLVREPDELVHAADAIGIAPICWTQRAAASRATPGPPTIQPAASASPAPVVSRTSSTGSAGRSSPSNEQPRAPRLRIQTASNERPTVCSSSSLANTTSGLMARTASLNSASPLDWIALQEARSTLICAPPV